MESTYVKYCNSCMSVTMAGTCNIKKIFLFKVCLLVLCQAKANKRIVPQRVQIRFLTPNILASVNMQVASLQITLLNRESHKPRDSFYPNEDVSQAPFSQNVVQRCYRLSHQVFS